MSRVGRLPGRARRRRFGIGVVVAAVMLTGSCGGGSGGTTGYLVPDVCAGRTVSDCA